MYLLCFWCCHHTLYLLYLLFLIVHSAMWTPCKCVVLSSRATFGANISHADCGIVFQILQVQVKCHTVFIESFCILMYYILLTDVWLVISCKWWYDVILIIPWIIQKQLCIVIFSGSIWILYLLACSIVSHFLFLMTPNPFHNLILVTELSFSVFFISSSSSLTPSVSSFFVEDWITSYVTANVAKHVL